TKSETLNITKLNLNNKCVFTDGLPVPNIKERTGSRHELWDLVCVCISLAFQPLMPKIFTFCVQFILMFTQDNYPGTVHLFIVEHTVSNEITCIFTVVFTLIYTLTPSGVYRLVNFLTERDMNT
ncbi:hypothetical protein ACJX0J_025025, partial [Zea mays]